MRTAYVAVLLCTLVLVHDVSSLSFSPWFNVWRYGWWPVKSAQFSVWKMLGIAPFNYQLWMKWAAGSNWNFLVGRYLQYRVRFNIKLNHFPFNKYTCRAWVVWPKFSGPYLEGGSAFNYCVPYK